MNRSQPEPTLGAVLREPVMAGQPRALPRPASLARSQGSQVPGGLPIVARGQEPVDPPAAPAAATVTQDRLNAFKQAHEEGLKAGYEQGLEEGRRTGEAEVRKAHEELLQALRLQKDQMGQLLTALPEALRAQDEAALRGQEEDLIALCFTVVCRILGDRLVTREALAQQVKMAIDHCCGRGSGSVLKAIHLNPIDLERLQGDFALAEHFRQQGLETMPWVRDEQVSPGGCLVRSTQGNLDARLETQLQALKTLLLQGRRPSHKEPA